MGIMLTAGKLAMLPAVGRQHRDPFVPQTVSVSADGSGDLYGKGTGHHWQS